MTNESYVAVRWEDLPKPGDLPALPPGFEEAIKKVASMHGQPMFRIVNGLKELKFRNGKMDIKHLLQAEGVPVYVPVIKQSFRRQSVNDPEYFRVYHSHEAAVADPDPGLKKEVEYTNHLMVRAVGKPCWIVEVWVSPDEIGEANWNMYRFKEMQVNGIVRKVDLLGPFPKNGVYHYCFPVVDSEGNAIAPNERTLEECRRRWWQITHPDVDAAANDLEERAEKFERKQVAQMADNFYQYHGVTARRLHGGAISKPLVKVYE